MALEEPSRGPSPWDSIARASSPPRPPRLTTQLPVTSYETAPTSAIATSSVSSPSAPDSDCTDEVDALFEGIDRIRIDDLWSTPRGPSSLIHTHKSAPFRAGLFAPPQKKGAFAAIPHAEPQIMGPPAPHSNQVMREVRSIAPLRSVPLAEATSINTARLPPPPPSAQQHVDFPRLFKVYACRDRAACIARGDSAECFGYHGGDIDRRRMNVNGYKPHMCRFVEEAGGCRKGDRCPFSHNDFERRYHPDRFGKETCRDFLRGDCPRRYCTFRHEVSSKVEVVLTQFDAMNDKELLQLVLKISEPRGKALCEKLLRRFGHGKKHSGWRLEGFNPRGREEQKVRFVTVRVEEVKRQLRLAGEKKWSATLKTSSLRDMMSGVRKVAEEARERCRSDENYMDIGADIHRLIRAIFSNTNWSCHSQEGDNPFLVTPENQNDALTALEKLVKVMLAKGGNANVDAWNGANENANNNGTVYDGNTASMLPQSNSRAMVANQDLCYQSGYLGVASGGDFGAIGERVGAEGTGGTPEVSKLWALPSSVGQMTA